MIQSSLKQRLAFPVGEVMAALLVIQPLLDANPEDVGQKAELSV